MHTLDMFAVLRCSVLSRIPHTHTQLHTYTRHVCCAATQCAFLSYAANTHSLTCIHTRSLPGCNAVCSLICRTHTLSYIHTHDMFAALRRSVPSRIPHTLSNADICLVRCNVVCLIVCVRNFVCVYLVCMYVRVCVSGMYRRMCVSAVF